MTPEKECGYKNFFMKFIKPHACTMVILIILNFVGMLFSLINPLLTRSLIDDVFIDKKTEIFGYILFGVFGIYIVSAIAKYISDYIKGKLELILFKNISGAVFDVVQFASLEKTQEFKVGDLLSRIMNNVHSVISIFTLIIPYFLMSITSIVAPLLIMLKLNVQLTLVFMMPIIFFLLSSLFFGKQLRHKQRTSLDKTALVYSFLTDSLSKIYIIKVFGLEAWAKNKFNDNINEYYDSSIDVIKTSSLNSSFGSLINGLPIFLLFSFGGTMVIRGSLTLGTFMAFMSYVALFFAPISQLSHLWTFFKSSSASFDRVNEILMLNQDDTSDGALIVRDGNIEFYDVWFSYDNKPILEGFNAIFKKGLNYIVGDNGTGKTTILKLISSLYPLKRGYITIDGQNISKVAINDLRKNISMVFSDSYLFDASIYENILLGDLSASEGDVINAAKQVHAHEFIKRLPKGYETDVGENGLKLSSGEKQKIALARSILKDTPIMLLDEVTKSIDAESRQSINETIKKLKTRKTLIIVTHNMEEIDYGSNVIYLEPPNHYSADVN